MAKDVEKKKGKGMLAKIKEKMEHAAEMSKRMKSQFRVREGKSRRIRFINDFEDCHEVVQHSKYQVLWPTPCLTYFGEECPYCDNDDFKSEEYYVWTVRDLEDKELKLLVAKPTGMSMVGVMMLRYEKYGTLLDRPYEVSVKGKRWSKTFDMLPEPPQDWKKEYKPFSKEKAMAMMREAGGEQKNGGNDD